MSSFEGKVIAITGAASGMGLATATILASKGAIISLADLSEQSLQKAVECLPGGSGKHMCTKLDVREGKAVDGWIETTVQKFGKLDGAVNMAGVITHATPLVETSDEAWKYNTDINATGVFYCLRAELRAMKDSGSIVSAASVSGQMGSPGNVAYAASKAAVISLTRTAAKEHQKIRVNCVAPGSVDTPMSRGENQNHVGASLQKTAMKRRAAASEIANVITFLLSEEASFVTGATYNVDGGWVC